MSKSDMKIEEFAEAVEHIPDEELFPVAPADVKLTVAPDSFTESNAFIKGPGLTSYESVRGSDFIPTGMLAETLTMEALAKSPHPNIITYLGCHVKRGRITAIVLEDLDKTLMDLYNEPNFGTVDKKKLFAQLESAINHLHSLGMAHNDINPHNIMIKDSAPILIDFGSCQLYGKRLQSLGSPGWSEGIFYTSEKSHDDYSINKVK